LDAAQHEAKEESKEKERQIKLRQGAEQRVQELEWYFLPTDGQEKSRDFSTPALLLLKKKKIEMATELEDIKKKHARKITDSIEELHQRFIAGIKGVPDANKEATAYQLRGLMEALEAASFPLKSRLKICVVLVEGLVDPEIIREMRILTEIMVQDSLHFMDTPETVILLAQREIDEQNAIAITGNVNRGEIVTFRDVLLERLATMRAKRSHQPKKTTRQGILDEIFTS